MKMIQSKSKKLVSVVAAFFMVLFGMMATGCGGGGGDSYTPPPTVEAPGVPINFVVAPSAVGGDLSATLSWAAPISGGPVASYELYRYSAPSTTPLHLISLSSTTYEFIDNAGLERGTETCWVLAAKNAGGGDSYVSSMLHPSWRQWR